MKDESGSNKKANRRSSGRKARANHGNSPQHRIRNAISLKSSSSDSSSWPHFRHFQDDEDYIVFCFREDGAFDVVSDGKSESVDCFDSEIKISQPINRKLCYDEVAETIRNSSHERGSNPHGYDICIGKEEEFVTVNENEQQTSYLDAGPVSGSRTPRYEVKENDNGGTVSVESYDSNQSDGSAGSFSFPVLQRDFMGSPVQMPKAGGLQMRKQRVPCAHFQCFRF